MSLIVFLVAVLGAAQVPAVSAGDAQRNGRVRGVVVRADDRMPVARATVVLVGTGDRRWESSSDDNGRFEFPVVAPGRCFLSARKASYVSGPATVVELAAGQNVEDIVIAVGRGGAIEGRIVDERGEPVVEAHVRALRAQYVSGGRRLYARHSVQTNDLGAFRLYGLPPGRYFIAAALRSVDLEGYNPERPPTVTRGASGFAPTFFPGTALAADGQPLSVRAGETLPGVDFMLRSVRLARVSGGVVDARGRPASEMVVMLNPARMGGASVATGPADRHFVQTSADGSFVLSNVKPGDYRIDVRSRAAMEAIARSGGGVGISQSGAPPEYASVALTVGGDDIEGLRVVTSTGHRLTGRLIVQGAAATPDVVQSLSVATYDASTGPGISAVMLVASTPVQPDGAFELRGVSGRRVVDVQRLPHGWALHSVRVAGVDLTDHGIEIRNEDVSDVEVVLTAKPARITGVVVDAAQRPIAGAGVIVFPADRSQLTAQPSRRVASATTDMAGAFEIAPLPAGEYLVAAVDELIDGEWAEPDYLETLRTSSVTVSLRDAETATVTLRR